MTGLKLVMARKLRLYVWCGGTRTAGLGAMQGNESNGHNMQGPQEGCS